MEYRLMRVAENRASSHIKLDDEGKRETKRIDEAVEPGLELSMSTYVRGYQ